MTKQGSTCSKGRQLHEWKLPQLKQLRVEQVQAELIKKSDEKESYVLLTIQGVLMIAAILLVSSSSDISSANTCELNTALESLSLNYTPSCKYYAIKDKSNDLPRIGIAVLCCNGILFLVILSVSLLQFENKKLVFFGIHILVFIVAVILFILILIQNNEFGEARRTQKSVDYIRLQSEMLSSLQKHFTSDNASSSDEISSNWNNFFIKYDCCAVREVQGTTNDFDTTPWCTTSGSCQSTASQIPKTCCKDVTPDDYQNALSACHASVNPGTFKPGCISRVKTLSVVNIDECQVCVISLALLTLTTLQIFEAIAVVLLISLRIVVACMPREKLSKTSPDNRECNIQTQQKNFTNTAYER